MTVNRRSPVGLLATIFLLFYLGGCHSFSKTIEADRLLKAGETQQSIDLYEESLTSRKSPRTLKKLNSARHIRGEELATSAAKLQKNQEHQPAFESLSLALSLDDNNPVALQLLEESRLALIQDAKTAENSNRPAQALDLYRLILTQYKRDKLAQSGEKRTSDILAEQAISDAKRQGDRFPEMALISYLKAATLQGLNSDAYHEAQSLARALKIDNDVGLVIVGTPENKLPQDLITSLNNTLKSQNPSMSSVIFSGNPNKNDLIFTLKLEGPTFKTSKQVEEKSEEQILKDDRQNNPKYPLALADLERAQFDIMQAEKAQINAETQWQEARKTLLETPGSSRAIQEEGAAMALKQATVSQLIEAQSQLRSSEKCLEQTPEKVGVLETKTIRYTQITHSLNGKLTLEGSCSTPSLDASKASLNKSFEWEENNTSHPAVPALNLTAKAEQVPHIPAMASQLWQSVETAILATATDCRERQIRELKEQTKSWESGQWREAAAAANITLYFWTGDEDHLTYLIDMLKAPDSILKDVLTETRLPASKTGIIPHL